MGYELGPDGFITRPRAQHVETPPARRPSHQAPRQRVSFGSVVGSGILGSLLLGMGGCLVLFFSRMSTPAGRDSILPFAGAYDNPFWLVGLVVGMLFRLAVYVSGSARGLLVAAAIGGVILYGLVQSSSLNSRVAEQTPVSAPAPTNGSNAPVRQNVSRPKVRRRTAPQNAPTRQQAFVVNPSVRPSFDCNRATTPSERIICSDQYLASLDVQMVAAFRDALSRLAISGQTELRSEHLQWFKNYARTCNSAASDPAQLRRCVENFLSEHRDSLRAR